MSLKRDRIRASRLRRTTVFRLAMIYAGLFGLTVGAIFIIVYWLTSTQLQAQIDTGLVSESDALVALYRDRGLKALEQAVRARSRVEEHLVAPAGPADPGRRLYILANARHRHVAGNLRDWPAHAAAGPPITLPVDGTAAGPDNQARWMRARVASLSNGYYLLIAQALDEANELRGHILISLLVALAAALAIGLAGGVWMGRSVLLRIDGISGAAGEIMGGDLSRRVPLGGRDDEFAELARRLNAMLDRIEALMRGMREVTDNIAHDLRGPLSRLRGRLEVTLLEARDAVDYRTAMHEAIADADGLLRTFNALLSIARLQAGVRREPFETVDLSELCQGVVELYGAVAEEAGLKFTSEITPGVRLRGHPELLAQALGNLLDNAIKYVPAGGTVHVRLDPANAIAVLEVADDGPGIPAHRRDDVLERFVRLDSSRSRPGNGLGLSLVQAVATAHGGRVVLADNRPGLRIRLELPRTDSSRGGAPPPGQG